MTRASRQTALLILSLLFSIPSMAWMIIQRPIIKFGTKVDENSNCSIWVCLISIDPPLP